MPAVALNHLRAQLLTLLPLLDNPAAFQNALRELLDTHANRAYRAGQSVQPQPLLPSYRVAPLVLRQLELELGKACQQRPAQMLEILDILWQDPYLEPRMLATALIGMIPGEYGAMVIAKLRTWAQPDQNYRILEALFQNGTVMLRQTNPEPLIGLLEEWLSDTNTGMKLIGLRALVPLIEDEAFINLPPIYRIISPLLQNFPPALNIDLQKVAQALIRRAPTETTYFLLQVLTLSHAPSTARLVRRCMPLLSPEQQSSLRAALARHAAA